MRKFQLKRGYRDGSVAPQDFHTGKVFVGNVIHEYESINYFIASMLEGGYIEEVIDKPVITKANVPSEEDIELFNQLLPERKKGKNKINGQLTA